jgi:hypothetical protein
LSWRYTDRYGKWEKKDMVVYIQKKIKGIWRTVLTTDPVNSSNVLNHLCKQYCKYKFRISMEKTDDMPIKLEGLSKDEALDALCDIRLADLTWKESVKAFKQIVDIVVQVHERYKR